MGAKVNGLDRLRAKLAALPNATRSELRAALNVSADELVAMQQRLVPVDEGDVRNSIEKHNGRHDLEVIVQAGGERAFYARWLEFGTQKMRGRPFFFPAYRALRKRIKGRASRAAGKAAKRVAAGGN